MWNKYCKKKHSVIAQDFGVSQIWRKILQIKEKIEYNTYWKIKKGGASFYFDNWTNLAYIF